jgi:uncharacterized protein
MGPSYDICEIFTNCDSLRREEHFMLIEFSVGNFKSFKEKTTFSMVAAKINAKDKKLDQHNVFKIDDDLSLLKSAAIYGANASGKSNLASSIKFMRRFVLDSSRETQATETIPVENFRLSTETEGKPSFFEVVFLIDHRKYRYGFEVNSQHVVSEWLFHVPTTKEARLFIREGSRIRLSQTFKEGKGITDKTRDNALLLSVSAQFNGTIAQHILKWFRQFAVISGLSDLGTRNYTIKCLEGNENKEDIVRFVKTLDLGIDDIQIEKTTLTADSLPTVLPEELKNAILRTTDLDRKHVKTVHRRYDEKGFPTSIEVFDIDDQESEGTKKLFALAGPLMDTLQHGKMLFVDEFDARLHPLITCAIIALFNSNETNPKNAQLIFATHDTNLLSNKIFRRDQIWFAEKDSQGATHLYSLVEYKVRNDASFESDYVRGKYGAIPFIGGLSRVIEEANA